MKRPSCCILAAIIAATCDADQIDKVIAKAMAAQHIPGASVAVLIHGRAIKQRSYGFSDLEQKVKATNQSAYMVGSVSKQFESTALLQLADEGRLKLDDPITKYLDGLPKAWSGITIRHLMTHTSGLKDYVGLPEHDQSQAKPVTPKQIMEWVGRYPLEFTPGTQWKYCNTGSYLEGLIIEKVTGKSYEEFAKSKLWRPLGMRSTRLNRWKDDIPNRAKGYAWGKGGREKPTFEDDTWPWAGGGVVTTLEDLVKWVQWLGSKPSNNRLWKPVQLAGSGSYPFGLDWFISDQRGTPRMFRTGGINGFSAILMRYPAHDITVILLTNEDGVPVRAFAEEIAQAVDPSLVPPHALAERPDPDNAMTDRITQALADISASNLDSKAATNALVSSTTNEDKQGIGMALRAHAKFHFLAEDDMRSHSVERLGSEIARIRHYRIEVGPMKLVKGFYLDNEGRLAFVQDE
ncbi:MAG: beta-lactamase family protein [Armatimonadetes bacterium]|nr:beta-lactamase family protein [Armatimonadota bacterium]